VLRAIHHAAYHDVVERQFGFWDEAEQDALFEENMARRPVDVLLLDGIIAGYCRITDHADRIEVEGLVIAPAYQGRGLGSTVLRGAMAAAADRDVPVHLQTHLENRAARLYRRLGFVEVGRTATHRLFRFDPPSASVGRRADD
jgi:ribosomal protein S18 acetylase RimI-like enzyme